MICNPLPIPDQSPFFTGPSGNQDTIADVSNAKKFHSPLSGLRFSPDFATIIAQLGC